MGVISAHIIGKIADAAKAEGLNRAELLRFCGLDAAQPIDPRQMVAGDVHYALWEKILWALRSPGFPIRYAATVRMDDYGAFGLALKTAPTLRESLARARRYLVVLTDTLWLDASQVEDGRLIFRREGARRLGMRCANEAAIAELVGTTREISARHYKPLQVTYRHQAPPDISEHQRFYGCPVHFEQEVDSVQLEPALFDFPLPKADQGLSAFLVGHLDELLEKTQQAPTLESNLRGLVSDSLPSGAPKIDPIAQRLGMSRRTLARRLAEEGTTFTRFVEDTRSELAKHLLRRTSHSLIEIGFLLGFAEQSAFQRAFKRWTGITPGAFRAQRA